MSDDSSEVEVEWLDLSTELSDRALTDEELDDLTSAEADTVELVYKNQEFDVAGLVARLVDGRLIIPGYGAEHAGVEGFQRAFVWTKRQMDRFIESVLLGYPVPGVFLVRNSNTQELLVLDGQQRLTTLRLFRQGRIGSRRFALSNVASSLKGLTYQSLSETQKLLFDDTPISAIVVYTDGSKGVNASVFRIFERLNSGGTQLTSHEIRVALFAGPVVARMAELNRNVSWRALYGSESKRLRDQELVMRILAMYLSSSEYSRPMKSFLNWFLDKHESFDAELVNAESRFIQAADLLARTEGPAALRWTGASVNAAHTEALFVGLMRRLDHDVPTPEQVAAALQALRDSQDYEDAVSRATADNDQVATRLRTSIDAFAGG